MAQDLAALRDQLLRQQPDMRLQLASQRDVAYLQAQNQRLFALLRKSRANKHFALAAEACAPLRYLGPEDRQRWVPEKAFQLLHDRRLDLPAMSEAQADALLAEINRAFAEREQDVVAKAHLFCRNCAAGLPSRAVPPAPEQRDKAWEELQRRNYFLEEKMREQTRVLGRTLRKAEKRHKQKLRNEVIKLVHRRGLSREIESRARLLAAVGPGRARVQDILALHSAL